MLETVAPQYRERLKAKLELLPDHPGVYLHKNAQGDIIYIGKAISLKNRVRQYFQSSKNQQAKVSAMVRNIADFDYVLTESESEALTLESNLIKQYRPYYNILLKDDKNFPYVRINMRNPFPRVEIVHKIKKDGAKYFGPYLSKHAISEAIEAIRENFPLRTCKRDIPRSIQRNERPCLNYYIHRCIGPCTGNVSREEYRILVEEVIDFLQGKNEAVLDRLHEEMMQASDQMEFERAALLRDRIQSIESLSIKQKAIAANKNEYDVFAIATLENDVLVYAFLVRDGKIVGAEHYTLIASDETEENMMSSFLRQFYTSGVAIPKEIEVNIEPSEREETEEWLSQQRKSKVMITVPQRGQKSDLVALAKKNAEDQLMKQSSTRKKEWERTEGASQRLADMIGMDQKPIRIECFDISHTAGTDPVASMIVFENGKPAKKQYRRFRLRTTTNDDYASMKEVLSRRFSRGLKEREEGKQDGFVRFPDLLIVDGGKGQLSVAIDALQELGIYHNDEVFIIGLSEKMEEIWLPGHSESLVLKTGSPELHLIQRVRDEAHRFAITYHRSLRQKTALFSILDTIPGIGPKRKKILFDHFVSLEAIKQASVEELSAVKGMDQKSSQAVFQHFHSNEIKHD